MNERSSPDQLDWLAFCYAVGELNDAESAQFEARLASDQVAREALARAVELTQSVAAAESQCGDLVAPALGARSEWHTRLSWMAIGGLASLLLALLWSGVVGPTWQTARRSLRATSQQNLAWAWTETRTQFASDRDSDLWPAAVAAATELDDELGTGDIGTDDSSVGDAPSWLTAAVFSRAGEPLANERVEN
jgi:hypothetical protein